MMPVLDTGGQARGLRSSDGIAAYREGGVHPGGNPRESSQRVRPETDLSAADVLTKKGAVSEIVP